MVNPDESARERIPRGLPQGMRAKTKWFVHFNMQATTRLKDVIF
jgi:hypothetical protein